MNEATREQAFYRASVFTVATLAYHAGHEAGDYLEQPDRVARDKQKPGRAGRRALHRHVAGYSVAQLAATVAALRVTGLRVPWTAVAAGQIVNAAGHWLIDRGPLLRRYAQVTGKTRFASLGTPPATGLALMDQAAHKSVQIPVAAAVTALLAGAACGRHGRRTRTR